MIQVSSYIYYPYMEHATFPIDTFSQMQNTIYFSQWGNSVQCILAQYSTVRRIIPFCSHSFLHEFQNENIPLYYQDKKFIFQRVYTPLYPLDTIGSFFFNSAVFFFLFWLSLKISPIYVHWENETKREAERKFDSKLLSFKLFLFESDLFQKVIFLKQITSAGNSHCKFENRFQVIIYFGRREF